MIKRLALRTSALAVISMAMTPVAIAQVIPGSARPDLVERRSRIQDERPMVGGAPVIQVPGTEAKSIGGKTQFVLNAITIENGTVYNEKDLKPIYEDKLGKKITLGELNGIAADITTYYRNHGYILTRAVIPPQRAAGGNVKIRIVEGFVSDVKIVGPEASNKQIQKFADKIRASKPLDAKALERYLLLMDDLPGVEARAVLQPSADTPGASEVIVTVDRRKYEFAATLDNRGSRFLGPLQLGVTGAVNNLFGYDDQTQVRVVDSINDPDELVYGEIRHEEQIGSEGTKIVLAANQARTKPGHTLDVLDIDGTSTAYSVGASHPILRSRRANWFVNGDFTVRNVDVDSLGLPLYYDKTRVLNLGTAYDFVDSTLAITRMDLSASHGFEFGTDVLAQPRSRANADPEFTKLNARISRIQPISGPWSIYGVAQGQASFDPLVASEEFAIGGSEFGGAYDSAELTGDSGAAARLEVQYNKAREGWLSQYQLYGFYDIGEVWNMETIPATESSTASLSSAGLGARFNLRDSWSGGVEGAVPLTHKVSAFGADGSDPRVFFNLQYRY